MSQVSEVIEKMVASIVDSPEKILITSEDTGRGILFEIKVGKDDVGKLIGKGGRVATALRTVAKAAGAKQGIRVLVNVVNTGV